MQTAAYTISIAARLMPSQLTMGKDDRNHFDSDIIRLCILRVSRNHGDDASDVIDVLYHLQSTHG